MARIGGAPTSKPIVVERALAFGTDGSGITAQPDPNLPALGMIVDRDVASRMRT